MFYVAEPFFLHCTYPSKSSTPSIRPPTNLLALWSRTASTRVLYHVRDKENTPHEKRTWCDTKAGHTRQKNVPAQTVFYRWSRTAGFRILRPVSYFCSESFREVRGWTELARCTPRWRQVATDDACQLHFACYWSTTGS